ncbi:MAG: SDR family oxidoreductase [Anaerolineae bacterium]
MIAIDLSGRKALVTGGARGIGAGIVRVLTDCGASVAFTHTGSIRGSAAADELVSEQASAGHQVCGFPALAEDPNAMYNVVKRAAEAMAGLDILVPNVGQNWVAPLESLDLQAWQRAVDLNLNSAFIALKAAYPRLKEAGRADVVLIGSSGVIDGGGGGAHYAAAKAGLQGMMAGLMRELPGQGIHINVIHPCVVDTDLLRERYDDEKKRAKLIAQVPVGRLARPEDIGHLVAFLCSELGSFICGQSILVDGGRTLWK